MERRMVIAGTVSRTSYKSHPDLLRLYRLDTHAIKDIKDSDLAPYAEKLGVINFADVQIPAVRELYPVYYKSGHTSILRNADACYVLGTFGEGGYVCIRPHIANNYIQVIPRSRLVGDVKKGKLKLLNAVIEQTNGVMGDVVSPITGVWEDMSHLKGRTLVGAQSDDAGDVHEYKHDKRDKIGAEETVDSHDELGMLNAEQKEFLKNYYIEYSVETFDKLVGKVSSWTLKTDAEIKETNKKKRETKLARLAELRTLSNGETWRFAGLWDVGYVSSRDEHKCEFGHKLRYIYMACPVNKPVEQARKEGTLLRFGIVCHAEFLNIPPEEAARLGKLLNVMCSEIAFISTVVANDAVEKHNELMASMHDLLSRLEARGNLTSVVGQRLAEAYRGFVKNQLPLVESFVLDVVAKLSAYGPVQVLSAAGIDTSLFAATPTKVYSLPELVSEDGWERRNYHTRLSHAHVEGVNALFRTHDPYPTVLTSYADMLIRNDIAGEYMYNPVYCLTDFVKGKNNNYQRYGSDEIVPACHPDLRKYLYGYNAETRSLREGWMRYFEHNTFSQTYLTAVDGQVVPCLTLKGLEDFMALAARLMTAGKNIEQGLGRKTLMKAMLDMGDALRYGYSRTGDAQEFKRMRGALLLTSVPYVIHTGMDMICRRAAFVLFESNDRTKAHNELTAMLDATAEGTDAEFLEAIKQKYEEPQIDVSVKAQITELKDLLVSAYMAAHGVVSTVSNKSSVEELKAATNKFTEHYTEFERAYTKVCDLVNGGIVDADLAMLKDVADRDVITLNTDKANLKLLLQDAMTAAASNNAGATSKSESSDSQAAKSSNPYRGDAAEAKQLATEFMELYDQIPKVLLTEPTIQIAVDIIERFRTKFKEKEGFTSREKWRVNQELERLKRLAAQRNK